VGRRLSAFQIGKYDKGKNIYRYTGARIDSNDEHASSTEINGLHNVCSRRGQSKQGVFEGRLFDDGEVDSLAEDGSGLSQLFGSCIWRSLRPGVQPWHSSSSTWTSYLLTSCQLYTLRPIMATTTSNLGMHNLTTLIKRSVHNQHVDSEHASY
jgi:hypothetical protein